MHSHIDFGYPWLVVHGHIIPAAVAGGLTFLAWKRKWNKWLMLLLGLVAAWGLVSYGIMRTALNFNQPGALPTQAFLQSGGGKVLDIGAGTGRSALMVLEARPNTTITAVDLFERSYTEHFGNIGDTRLMQNMRAVGLDSRVTVQKADMRQLPFAPAEFDAIISAYAIDHVNTEGIHKSLAEASRVIKPGGDFLLMVLNKDGWLNFVWGPMLLHSGTRPASRWVTFLNEAGFDILEQGRQPGTFYFLARKR